MKAQILGCALGATLLACNPPSHTTAEWLGRLGEHVHSREAELTACYQQHVTDRSAQAVYVYFANNRSTGTIDAVAGNQLASGKDNALNVPYLAPLSPATRGESDNEALRSCVIGSLQGFAGFNEGKRNYVEGTWLIRFEPNQVAKISASASKEKQP